MPLTQILLLLLVSAKFEFADQLAGKIVSRVTKSLFYGNYTQNFEILSPPRIFLSNFTPYSYVFCYFSCLQHGDYYFHFCQLNLNLPPDQQTNLHANFSMVKKIHLCHFLVGIVFFETLFESKKSRRLVSKLYSSYRPPWYIKRKLCFSSLLY